MHTRKAQVIWLIAIVTHQLIPKRTTAETAPAFRVSQEPVVAEGTEGDAHKYEAAPLQDYAPAPPSVPEYENLGTLPATYEEDTLFLAARDPRWLFSYWDFDWSRYPAFAHRYGVAQFFLKLTTFAGEQETMVEIKPEARNWYVPVNQPDTTYLGEIGYFDRNATWIRIVSSGPAHTPARRGSLRMRSRNLRRCRRILPFSDCATLLLSI